MALTPLVEQVTAHAFHRAPVAGANAAIEAARAMRSADGQQAVSYEVALPALAPDEFLTRKTRPKLVYFLDCRGVVLRTERPATPLVFVSLFTPEGLFFVEAGVVVAQLGAACGLSLDELVRRYGADGRGDPPLLGAR